MDPITDYMSMHSMEAGKTHFEDMHKILRGELSATDAYRQSMEKLDSKAEKLRLKQFCQDHEIAADYWRQQLKVKGEIPDVEPGAWGTVVKGFVSTAKLLGNTAALKALKEGEEHGLSEYKELLQDNELTEDQRRMIKESFIPNQERHITSINAMMKMS